MNTSPPETTNIKQKIYLSTMRLRAKLTAINAIFNDIAMSYNSNTS